MAENSHSRAGRLSGHQHIKCVFPGPGLQVCESEMRAVLSSSNGPVAISRAFVSQAEIKAPGPFVAVLAVFSPHTRALCGSVKCIAMRVF